MSITLARQGFWRAGKKSWPSVFWDLARWQTSGGEPTGKEKDMETQSNRISICTRCGVHQKDRTRDFFPLWFVDLEKRAGWCPRCAGVAAKTNSRQEDRTCITIPLQAIWSIGR